MSEKNCELVHGVRICSNSTHQVYPETLKRPTRRKKISATQSKSSKKSFFHSCNDFSATTNEQPNKLFFFQMVLGEQ